MKESINADLIKLAKDLYSEGYACGIATASEEKWFDAWAIAMERVATGEAYTHGLVGDIFIERDE